MPAIAAADQPTGPAMQAPTAAMQAAHQRMEQLHQQARSQILAALTPAHKALLARIVGELAIAPTPDVEGAARQLNAALSPGESGSILKTANGFHQAMRASMEATRAQIEKSEPSEKGATVEKHVEFHSMSANHALDAGHILLMLASPSGHGMGEHVMMMNRTTK
jgi:hypothetical protein